MRVTVVDLHAAYPDDFRCEKLNPEQAAMLADLKLLRIGINRVLIEQDGQKKELMIFDGYGGDSLLPTNTPNENYHP